MSSVPIFGKCISMRTTTYLNRYEIEARLDHCRWTIIVAVAAMMITLGLSAISPAHMVTALVASSLSAIILATAIVLQKAASTTQKAIHSAQCQISSIHGGMVPEDIDGIVRAIKAKHGHLRGVQDLLRINGSMIASTADQASVRCRRYAMEKTINGARSRALTRIQTMRESSPAIRASNLIAESLNALADRRSEIQAAAKARYAAASWWGKMTHDEPDVSSIEEREKGLRLARYRLAQSGDIERSCAYFEALASRVNSRTDDALASALTTIPKRRENEHDSEGIARGALWLSMLSVPISAWNDVSTANSIYDALRNVHGGYAGSSDVDIWIDALTMPPESLAGLASLAKGAWFEQLVQQDTGGELFEHFNHPGTDIVIDGIAYQIKATTDLSYVNSVPDDIQVISTSEIAELTGSVDGGYLDVDLDHAVDLALGGTIIDFSDTALDALLSGLGGLGLMATIRGVMKGRRTYKAGYSATEAAVEGVSTAVLGTMKTTVDGMELCYKGLTSRPSRAVGRGLLWVGTQAVNRIDRALQSDSSKE